MKSNAAMRSVKFESVTEIPERKLTRLIKEAVAVVSALRTKQKARLRAKRDSVPMPKELKMAPKKSATATKSHDSLSLSGKHEYNAWISETKRRLKNTIEMHCRGERLHDKYP